MRRADWSRLDPRRSLLGPALTLVLALGLLATPQIVAGQEVPSVATGDRVRLVTADRSATYTASVVGVRPDTLVVRRRHARVDRWETVAIPAASIRSLEVRIGEKSAVGKGAVIGAAVGGGLGLALGLGAAAENDGGWFDVGPGEVVAGTVVMAGIGALIGMGIGAVSKTDEWAPVPLRTLRVVPTGEGVTVGASVPLRF